VSNINLDTTKAHIVYADYSNYILHLLYNVD